MTAARIIARHGRRQRWGDVFIWLLGYGLVFGAGLTVAAFAFKRSYQPYIGVSLAGVILVMCGWTFRPRQTLNATVFFALIGDIVTIKWFPFNKNLSSRESILFISDGVSLSPLELVLLSGVVIVATRRIADGDRILELGAVGRPMLVFVGFAFFGLAYGMSRGGDFRAAMFEFRPLMYMPLVYFLAVALCTKSKHHRQILWVACTAVYIQSLLSMVYLLRLDAETRESLESLTEHGSAIGMNMVFMFTLASLTYRNVGGLQRALLVLLFLPPVAVVYLVSQRRAGVVTLGVAILLLLIVLFWRQRSTFWKLAPALAIVSVGYIGAFWNSESTLGFPAQAVKSVVAPGELSAKDQSSDQYRILENLNVNATIRAAPVTGLGFGQTFYRPYALPDISVFEFNGYVPHNSFLWLWIKTGFFGFVAMVYLLGRTVLIGSNRIRGAPAGSDAVTVSAALFFVVMFTVFTYVDIAWGSRNMVFLGAAIAIATSSVRLGPTEENADNATEQTTDDTQPEPQPPRSRSVAVSSRPT